MKVAEEGVAGAVQGLFFHLPPCRLKAFQPPVLESRKSAFPARPAQKVFYFTAKR